MDGLLHEFQAIGWCVEASETGLSTGTFQNKFVAEGETNFESDPMDLFPMTMFDESIANSGVVAGLIPSIGENCQPATLDTFHVEKFGNGTQSISELSVFELSTQVAYARDRFEHHWSHLEPRELKDMTERLRFKGEVMALLLHDFGITNTSLIDATSDLRFAGNGHTALMFWRASSCFQRIKSMCLSFSRSAVEDPIFRKQLQQATFFLDALPKGIVSHLIIDIKGDLEYSYSYQRLIQRLFRSIPRAHVNTISVFGNTSIPDAIIRRFHLRRQHGRMTFHTLDAVTLHLCSSLFFLSETGVWGTLQLAELPVTRVLTLLNTQLDVGQMDILLGQIRAPNLQVLNVEVVWIQSIMDLTHRSPMIHTLRLYNVDGDHYIIPHFAPELTNLQYVCGDISVVATILRTLPRNNSALNIASIEIAPESLIKDPTSDWDLFNVEDMVSIMDEMKDRGVTSLRSLRIALPSQSKFASNFYERKDEDRPEAILDLSELYIGIICDSSEVGHVCSCANILMGCVEWIGSFRKIQSVAISIISSRVHWSLKDNYSAMFMCEMSRISPHTSVIFVEGSGSPYHPFTKPDFESGNFSEADLII